MTTMIMNSGYWMVESMVDGRKGRSKMVVGSVGLGRVIVK